jgi:hypothetical protein
MKSLVLCLAIFTSSISFAGGMVGNGGDAILQEFNLRGIQIAAYLKSEPAVASKYGLDAAKFLDVVKKTALEGQEHLILRGVEVDAINYPSELRIQVSRTRWAATATRMDAYFVQRRIALHEYLWIYGVDDTAYVVSNAIVAELEKAAAQILDPQVRELLLGRLCDAVDKHDFATAESLLTWGLDLNVKCPGRDGELPLGRLMYIIGSFPTLESSPLSLFRAMLAYGADPNQNAVFPRDEPLLTVAIYTDFEATKALLEFGANPNWTNSAGYTAFALGAASDGNLRLDAKGFELLLNSGGDVNLSGYRYEHVSPARVIVQKENNLDVVTALIKSGKTDWCRPSNYGWFQRTIDAVAAQYKPLLEQAGVKCGRFEVNYSQGATCDEAVETGKKLCESRGFKHFIVNRPTADSKDVCNGNMASVSCLDDDVP